MDLAGAKHRTGSTEGDARVLGLGLSGRRSIYLLIYFIY
jgi:hypothetical protein